MRGVPDPEPQTSPVTLDQLYAIVQRALEILSPTYIGLISAEQSQYILTGVWPTPPPAP